MRLICRDANKRARYPSVQKHGHIGELPLFPAVSLFQVQDVKIIGCQFFKELLAAIGRDDVHIDFLRVAEAEMQGSAPTAAVADIGAHFVVTDGFVPCLLLTR